MKFINLYALLYAHVGIAVNDIDIGRFGAGKGCGGLPDVRGRLPAQRDELGAVGSPVLTGKRSIEPDYFFDLRRGGIAPFAKVGLAANASPATRDTDADNAVGRAAEDIDTQAVRTRV